MIVSSAVWIVPAAAKTPFSTSHLFLFYMQHENATACEICLAKICHFAVMRDIHITIQILEMDRKVKCHPVSCSLHSCSALYHVTLSYTQSTHLHKRGGINAFCLAPEKLHVQSSILNTELTLF